jgi:hypothetical protein
MQRTGRIGIADHGHKPLDISLKPRFNVLRFGDPHPKPYFPIGIASLCDSQTPPDAALRLSSILSSIRPKSADVFSAPAASAPRNPPPGVGGRDAPGRRQQDRLSQRRSPRSSRRSPGRSHHPRPCHGRLSRRAGHFPGAQRPTRLLDCIPRGSRPDGTTCCRGAPRPAAGPSRRARRPAPAARPHPGRTSGRGSR